MGNKAHVRANRLGIISGWDAAWYANKKDFANLLYEDYLIRQMFDKKFPKLVGRLTIERTANSIVASVYTHKPGILIGPNGKTIQLINTDLNKKLKKEVRINIVEIKVPELTAMLVAKNIGIQLEERGSYKRVAQRAIDDAMHSGAEGIKIFIKGRPNGIEIARKIAFMKGRVPTQTLRADIDYACYHVKTVAGIVGVKVWIFIREVYGKRDLSLAPQVMSMPKKK